jgi:molecular chaperone DnaK
VIDLPWLGVLNGHDTSAVIGLRQDCVRAKKAVSADIEATIPVIQPTLGPRCASPATEFEDMICPSISATIEALRRALL